MTTGTTAVNGRSANTPIPPHEPRVPGWMWPVGVTALTLLYAMVPPFVGATSFYRRGDSASQFLPTWVHFGDLMRDGAWPPLMDPNSWHGGNYAAEALFGVYNPINALNWLVVSFIPNLDVSATLVKAEFLALLALGIYLLAREYGAASWAASLVAVALPFSGFTLYWDAATWAAGLIAFAYVPYVWWAFRRAAHGRLSPIWAFVVGALAITQGNPYGVLGVVVIGVAVLAEALLAKDWTAVRRIVLLGACVAALIPLVFMPLLQTAPLAVRANLAGVRNTDLMSPHLGDLLNLSSPTLLPDIKTFLNPMQVPATYFAWFVLPMLPWLRWSSLRSRLSSLAGLAVVFAGYFLLVAGPSVLWFFRWPLRLVEYAQLPFAVLLAVVASAGFRSDRRAARGGASVGLVVVGAYLAWAQTPSDLQLHAVATALVLALVLALVWAMRRSSTGVLPLVAVVQTGILLVLGLQTAAFPQNASAGPWNFPASVPALEDRFDSRYTGTTLQLASLFDIRRRAAKEGPAAWRDHLGGSMFHAVGVDSVNTYSGVGLKIFTKALCMDYNGATCPRALALLMKPTEEGRPNLAALMKVDTIVAQRSRYADVGDEPGWVIAEQDRRTMVLHPSEPWHWPGSRLSWTSPDVTVTSADTTGLSSETVTIEDVAAASTLVFARLGWPGFSAEINGRRLRVTRSDAGLLEVELPAGTKAGEVTVDFRPPGQLPGLGLAGLGALGAVAMAVLPALRRRREDEEGADTDGRAPTGDVAHHD